MSQLEPLTQNTQTDEHKPAFGTEAYAANEIQWMWMVGLLIMGMALVIFSNGLSIQLLLLGNNPGNNGWSPDAARDLALTIRFVGGLVFLAGLAERIIIKIGNLKI